MERCECSFTATLLSFERDTTLTVDHIGHCRDLFPSNHSTTAGYVPLALERRGNPRDFFLKTGNDRGRRVLLQPVSHFSTSDIHLPFIVSTIEKQSNGSKKQISMLLSHFGCMIYLRNKESQDIGSCMVTHIETRNIVVITHTSTAVVSTGTNAQVLQHGADRTQHTAFAYIATLSARHLWRFYCTSAHVL